MKETGQQRRPRRKQQEKRKEEGERRAEGKTERFVRMGKVVTNRKGN